MKLILGIYFNTVCGSRFNHFYGSQFDLALTCLPPPKIEIRIEVIYLEKTDFQLFNRD